jgi:CheY-like chemotaxis protein
VLSRILHVEDDLSLRMLVEITLESLGFRGTFVTAGTVLDAIEKLDEAAADVGIDLILCDLHLPDGLGLDVVRYVRASEVWRATPILILSSDVSPKNIGRAYALGANAYIEKSPPGRTLIQVLRSLYSHWTQDALLPPATAPDRVQQYIHASIALRTRHAHLYERMADRFGDSHSEAAFWNSRSLAESNLINLLGFLRVHCAEMDLPEGALEEIGDVQVATARALEAAEAALERESTTRGEAYRYILELVSEMNVEFFAQVIGHLFPVHPVAMETLRELMLATIEDVAAWVDLHTSDPKLHERAADLRSKLGPLTQPLPAATSAGEMRLR